jgi:hypothetical protein
MEWFIITDDQGLDGLEICWPLRIQSIAKSIPQSANVLVNG